MFDDPFTRVESGPVEMHAATSMDAMVKLVLTIAVMAAEKAAEARRERAEQEQQAATDKLWRERAAAEPWLRAPYDERFWANLQPTQEGMKPLARALQAGYEFGASDPQAAAALHYVREKIRTEFNVVVPDHLLPVVDLSRAIALANPDLQEAAHQGRQAAAERGEASYLYVIEDPSRDGPLATGEVRGPKWESPEVLAANTLNEWAAGPHGQPLGDHVVIRVLENVPGANGQDAAATVSMAQASQVIADNVERQRQLIAGIQTGSADEILHALNAEHGRVGAYADQRQAALDELLSQRPDPTLPEGEHQQQVDAAQQDLVRQRTHQARLHLQAQAVRAELRGEDPDLVYHNALLQSRLAQGWVESATPAEAAGVFSEVRGWKAGAARDEALNALNDQLFRHYGIELPTEGKVDRAAATAALQSMSDGGPEPIPEEVRLRALKLHDQASEQIGEALAIDGQVARMRRDKSPDPVQIEALQKKADGLRASAKLDTREAGMVERDADRIAAEPSGQPPGAVLPPGVTTEQVNERHTKMWDDDPAWEALLTAPPAPQQVAAAPVASGPVPSPAVPAAGRTAAVADLAVKAAQVRDLVPNRAAVEAVTVAGMDQGVRPEEAVRRQSPASASGPTTPPKGRSKSTARTAGAQRG